MEYLYHTVEAENLRDGYEQHSNVDKNNNINNKRIYNSNCFTFDNCS